MTAKHAIVIGLFQTLSLISGASRSGTAITGSLFLNYKKSEAAKYSLMLSIPTILGALIFSILEFETLEEDVSILTTFIPLLTTFIVSYLSYKFIPQFFPDILIRAMPSRFLILHSFDILYFDLRISIIFWIYLAGLKAILNNF